LPVDERVAAPGLALDAEPSLNASAQNELTVVCVSVLLAGCAKLFPHGFSPLRLEMDISKCRANRVSWSLRTKKSRDIRGV
jgi:hypothetical protein